MNYKVVAIKDRALDAFMQPWFTPTLGAAIRAFQDEVNKPDTPINKHADDYDLYYIGDYTDHDGKLKPLETPEQIAIAKQLTR